MPRRVVKALADAPYPMWVALAAAAAGSIQLGFQQYAPSVVNLLGNNWAAAWSAYLVVGGLLVVFGFSLHRPAYESMGLVFLAIAQIVYTVALLNVGGIPLLTNAMIQLFLAIAHGTRAYALGRARRQAEKTRSRE